jgi:hypothetical protein
MLTLSNIVIKARNVRCPGASRINSLNLELLGIVRVESRSTNAKNRQTTQGEPVAP